MRSILKPEHLVEEHIEIVGPTKVGKTTLAEWIHALLQDKQKSGLLLFDPTGDSYRNWVGWLAEGHFGPPVHLIDLDEALFFYNPLQAAKKDPELYVDGLYESLALMLTGSPETGQNRVQEHYVLTALQGLVENDKKLPDGVEWLQNQGLSSKEVTSAIHWFNPFTRGLLSRIFSKNGFDWEDVYPTQAFVLVNLNARKFANSKKNKQAMVTLMLNGLFNEASYHKNKRWYVVVDEAQDYITENIASYIKEIRHYELYFTLIHHWPFPGEIQKAIDAGCNTQFYFGDMPSRYQGKISIWEHPFLIAARKNGWTEETYQLFRESDSQNKVNLPSHLKKYHFLYTHGKDTDGYYQTQPTGKPNPSPEDIALMKKVIYSQGTKPEEPQTQGAVPTRPPNLRPRRGK